MSRRPRPTSVPSDILIHMCSHSTTIDVRRKLGAPPLLGRGGWVPIYHKVAWAEVYLYTKWHLDASSRLAAIKMGGKLGALPPFMGVGAGSRSNSVVLVEAYFHTKWHLDQCSRLATIDMGRKLGAPLFGSGLGPPSNTKSPGLGPTSMPSAILIHPAVWPQ